MKRQHQPIIHFISSVLFYRLLIDWYVCALSLNHLLLNFSISISFYTVLITINNPLSVVTAVEVMFRRFVDKVCIAIY